MKNAWGSTGYSYLGVKDDPFDYANPNSRVKQATVQKSNVAINYASLMELLDNQGCIETECPQAIIASSYNTAIQIITAITPHTPKYPSPSRLYTKMDFTMNLTTNNASNVLVTANTTVTCDIFSELESMLGLSIQSGENELWTVVENADSFTIESRRYGHGIGMSQRGAMYMGQMGYTYDEILGFYYPGCTRIGCTFTNTILAANSSEVITTEEVPAEFDDEPTTSVPGTVVLSSGTQIAVRNAKSTTGGILIMLQNGTPVYVLSNDGTWCLVKYGDIVGYLPTNTLSITGTALLSDSTPVSSIDGFAVVLSTSYLNLRDSGSYAGAIIGSAPHDAILTVFSWGSGWVKIQYGKLVAYAATEFMTFSQAYPGSTETGEGTPPEETGDTITATVATESGSLNLRQYPQLSSTVLTTIPQYATVIVTNFGDTWSAVTYGGYSGYVMTMFLSFDNESGSGPGSTGLTTVTATVTTVSGSLNLREDALAGSRVLTTIPKGTVVPVLRRLSSWSYTRYQGVYGYVMNSYLTFTGSENVATDAEIAIPAVVVTESGSLNMRKEPYGKVISSIPQLEQVDVFIRGTVWCYLRYNEVYGYAMTEFLSFDTEDIQATQTPAPTIIAPADTPGPTMAPVDTPAPTAAPSPIPTPDPTAVPGATIAWVATPEGSLNLRNQPNGDVLTTIPQYAQVEVLTSLTSTWCKVKYGVFTGYAMSEYLSPAEPQFQPEATATQAPVNDSDAVIAWVNTPEGSLNLRNQPNGDVLTTIPQYAQVTVLSGISSQWCKTSYNGYTGYTVSKYLSTTKPAQPAQTPSGGSSDTGPSDTKPMDPTLHTPAKEIFVYVRPPSGNAAIGLYDACSESAALLHTIPQDSQVEVIRAGDTWCEVRMGNMQGYCLRDGLSFFAE